MCLSSGLYLNDISVCANNARNRINPEGRAPMGAYSSGITLFAKNDCYISAYLHVFYLNDIYTCATMFVTD